MLTRKSIFSLWLVYMLGWLIVASRSGQKLSGFFGNVKCYIVQGFAAIKNETFTCILFAACVLLLLRSTYMSLILVPRESETLSSLLPRVMFWIEHGTTYDYVTQTPVFAGYLSLHNILLTGGDVFVNLTQNMAAYGSAILLYTILRRMDLHRTGALLGVFLMLTMNCFNLQASSSLTDLIAAFYILITVSISQDILLEEERISFHSKWVKLFVLLGVSCGLAFSIINQATLPFACVLTLLFLYLVFRKEPIVPLLSYGVLSGAIALAFRVPVLYRNYTHFGHTLLISFRDYMIDSFSIKAIILTMTKNCISIASGKNNRYILTEFAKLVASVLGIDLNAPETSLGSEFWFTFDYSESLASAYLIMLLFFVALVIGIRRLIRRRDQNDVLGAIMLLQFVVAVGFFKWEGQIVKRVLPSIILAIIPISYFIWNAIDGIKKKRTREVLTFLLPFWLLFAGICANGGSYDYFRYLTKYDNFTGQYMYDRFERYYVPLKIVDRYEQICVKIEQEGFRSVGLYGNSFVYPILARYYHVMPVENVDFTTEPQVPEDPARFTPDAVAVLDIDTGETPYYFCNGKQYACVYKDGTYSLWVRIDFEA